MTSNQPDDVEDYVTKYRPQPLETYRGYPSDEMLARATAYYADLRRRRTVRHFSDQPVDRAVIERCLLAAGTAPSGANLQPWHFVVVSDPETKHRIRVAAEAEEKEFYSGRAPKEWLEALAHIGTDHNKPFLETAPFLIAVFAERYGIAEDGSQIKHYYVNESVGLATGMLISAIHHAGLASLTHTPSPMGFLNEVLDRPERERPFLLLVVGHPTEDAMVPTLTKKGLDELATFI